MRTIIGSISEISPELEVAVAAYRHKIFIERLGWQLRVTGSLERDQFDRNDTIYIVKQSADGKICGCARLLPTVRPYLLSMVFPHLLAGSPAPAAPDVWELSRFASVSVDPDSGAATNVPSNTRELLGAAVTSAAQHGASRLITVSPLGVERLLLRMGVNAHRAGPPTHVDGKPVFACWIEIDEQTTSALGVSSNRHPPIQNSLIS